MGITFSFDANKSFDENVAQFVKHMRSVDADMTAILEAQLASIPALASDGARIGRNDRAAFNKAVGAALDALDAPKPNSAGATT